MKEKNYTGIIGTAATKYHHRSEISFKEEFKDIDKKKVFWTALHVGGFLFVSSILFLLVMLIVTS